MDGFLTKPAHLQQLREALQRYGGALATAQPVPAAAEPADADDALLDRATVADVRRALTPAKYADLLGGLFEGRHQTVAALREGAAAGSFSDLRSQAHALKGASLSLGLQRVGEAAGALEASAAGVTPAELMRQIDRLEAQFTASLEACHRLGLLPVSAGSKS
jgi:HPt (histidine-containing phosphotransfer) domain-containing protein